MNSRGRQLLQGRAVRPSVQVKLGARSEVVDSAVPAPLAGIPAPHEVTEGMVVGRTAAADSAAVAALAAAASQVAGILAAVGSRAVAEASPEVVDQAAPREEVTLAAEGRCRS